MAFTPYGYTLHSWPCQAVFPFREMGRCPAFESNSVHWYKPFLLHGPLGKHREIFVLARRHGSRVDPAARSSKNGSSDRTGSREHTHSNHNSRQQHKSSDCFASRSLSIGPTASRAPTAFARWYVPQLLPYHSPDRYLTSSLLDDIKIRRSVLSEC